MRKILAITIKDTLLRFTSPIEWAFFLILPIFFTLIIGGGTGVNEDQRVRFYVVDEAQTPLSSSLLKELENSSAVKPELQTMDKASADFEKRRVSALLIIPNGFTLESLQAGTAEVELRQQPSNINALAVQQGVQAALSRVRAAVDIARASTSRAEAIRPFADDDAREKYFNQALTSSQNLIKEAPQRLTEKEGTTADPIDYDPRANSATGQMLTWVFIPLIGLSAMFAMERAGGTLRRVLTSPTSKAMFIGGTVFGQVLTAVIQMVILILFGALVMKLNWGEHPAATALMIVTFTLAAAALGTMLGTFVKTEGQANGLSIMIGMVMAMMGGCWYPIELFPEVIRTAAKILPTTWAMQGMLDVVLRGQGIEGVLLEAGILVGFAVVFFIVGVWRFRYE